MKQLSPLAQHWFSETMTWTDAFWDESKALLKSSDEPEHHTVRNTIWYALGLLQQGNRERAYKAIRAVLGYQYDTPGTVYHGTFKRSPLEPDPPLDPQEWKDYDPNWREFICTVFLLMLYDFELPEDLQAELWLAIYKASEGAYMRNVEAAYTNIALMSALLLDHAGKHFALPEWRTRAQLLAEQIYQLYQINNTFWEYNSPTYYGTDLYALSLWCDYGLTDVFQKLGAELEAALWHDIAQFYHADLRNLCGPYDRSYGMDMTDYVALLGLYIALFVPPERAPLPDSRKPFNHADDFMFGPLASYLGTRLPKKALPHLLNFKKARQLKRRVEENRSVTAYLSKELMLGAETRHPFRLANDQFHAATVHWQLADGALAWLRLRCDSPLDVMVSKQTMILSALGFRQIVFEVSAGLIDEQKIQDRLWLLPNLTILANKAVTTVEKRNGYVYLSLEIHSEPLILELSHFSPW